MFLCFYVVKKRRTHSNLRLKKQQIINSTVRNTCNILQTCLMLYNVSQRADRVDVSNFKHLSKRELKTFPNEN